MNRYEKYKSSGIDWIGEIPNEWEHSRIKYVCKIFGRIGFRGYTIADIVREDEGAISLSPSNIVSNKLLTNGENTYLSWEKYHESPEIKIREGDIVLVKTGSTIGKVAIVPFVQKKMTLNPQLVVLKSIDLNANFLFYLMASKHFQSYFDIDIAGGSTPAISQEKVNNFRLVFPKSFEEQTAIANYLDEKTTQIDKLIADKQKLIELLKEERTAIIKNAVSGIGKTWNKIKLKHIANVVLGKMLTNEDKGGYLLKPYLRAANMKWLTVDVSSIKEMWFSPNELEKLRVKKNDLLVSEGGEVGRTCIWQDELDECYIQNSVHKITFNQDQNPFFFLYQFYYLGSIGYFESIVNRISIGHLTGEKLNDLFVCFPSLKEQTNVVNHIQIESHRIDNTISKIEKEIELMNEYRTALISEVVTGKIKVI